MNTSASETIIQKDYQGDSSLVEMIALARRTPTEHLHTTDLPYRFCSWALDEPHNAALWYAGARLVGWAVLQTPFWTLDFATDPGLEKELAPRMLAWAEERARQVVSTPFGLPAWYVNVFQHQVDRIAALEAAGFFNQEHAGENSWSKAWMFRPGNLPAPEAVMPGGFRVRSLSGEPEVEAYVTLHRLAFGTHNMTHEWRQRTLHWPEYRPELDLVITAPGGELAAFCITWFDPQSRVGQIEPLGVHPEYRRLGLGIAILGEALQRLRALGAQQVCVETDDYREAALSLYAAAGFQIQQQVLVYGKDFSAV